MDLDGIADCAAFDCANSMNVLRSMVSPRRFR